MTKLNIYDKDGKITRQVEAATVDFEIGVIRKLAALIRIDEMTNNLDILMAASQSWEALVELLSRCFPDVTDEEWDRVKVKEIVPLIYGIFKDLLIQLARIPSTKKE